LDNIASPDAERNYHTIAIYRELDEAGIADATLEHVEQVQEYMEATSVGIGEAIEAIDARNGWCEADDLCAWAASSMGDADEPVDIFDGTLTPEPVLRRDMLPAVIADFAFDEAERLGVEPAMVAIPALVVCASALHDGITIQPKARDTSWTESARLWVGMIAPPGGKKTPAINAATAPLTKIEQDQRREDGRKLAEYDTAMERYKKTVKDSTGDLVAPAKPPMRRQIVGDATMEQLAYILADNERGVLMLHDELAGFIGGFDAYRGTGVQKDRAAALELWNGGYRTVDRRSGSVAVANWGASILGGIQPAKLREMASTAKMSDDGLLQRFLLFTGRTVDAGQDREPNATAALEYSAIVHRLIGLEPPVPARAIKLSAAAQRYRIEVDELAFALSILPTTPGALKGHMSKVPGTFARLLLTLHAVDCASAGPIASPAPDDLQGGSVQQGLPEVSEATAKRAYDLMVRYFMPQAIRTYGELFHAADAEAEQVRRVARYILVHDGEQITDRELYRGCRDLSGSEHARERQRIMKALFMYNWVEAVEARDPTPTVWQINPRVRDLFDPEREGERKRRDDECRRVDDATGIKRRAYGGQ
jgi:hypothetical protein